MKLRILAISIGIVSLLKISDWFLFEHLYFSFPNETEWDTSPWYNFIDHTKDIQFSDNEAGVLLVGSSVALYSTLPELIRESNDTEHAFRSELYSHVAMAPTDVHYYLNDIISKKPKLVVYVFNPADFQMEFISDNPQIVLEKDQTSTDKSGRDEIYFDYQSWLDHFSWRHPARLIYPNQFVWDYFSDLSRHQIYRLWGKGFLYINRYREFFWDTFYAYMERHFRRGRSYHIFTGSVPEEGIWQHGWTSREFTIQCNSTKKFWEDTIFIPQPNTRVEIALVDSKGIIGKEKQILDFSKSGWKDIIIDYELLGITSEDDSSRLRFNISKGYSSKFAENKPYGKKFEYGIRLSQSFCTDTRERNFSYKRPQYLEESRFRNMSLTEYTQDYYERIYKDNENRPELTRMKTLSDKKEMIRDSDFQPWLEIERFRQIQERLDQESIRFLLVLSPENPIELKKYQNGRWYYGMLDFFGELAEGHFFDFSSYLKDPRYFSDPHHLTYEGAEKFSIEVKDLIQKELVQGEGHE